MDEKVGRYFETGDLNLMFDSFIIEQTGEIHLAGRDLHDFCTIKIKMLISPDEISYQSQTLKNSLI